MNSETIVLLANAISTFGYETQKAKAVEEMGELIVELSREHCHRTSRDKVIEEVADVTIMMKQLALMYGVDEVQAVVDKKLQRLEERLKDYRL